MINSWTQEWNSVNWWTNKTWDPRAIIIKSIGKIFCIKQIKFVTSTCKVILLFPNLVFCGNFLHLSARRRVLFQLTNIAVAKIPFQEAIYAIIIVHHKVELVSLLIVEKKLIYYRRTFRTIKADYLSPTSFFSKITPRYVFCVVLTFTIIIRKNLEETFKS